MISGGLINPIMGGFIRAIIDTISPHLSPASRMLAAFAADQAPGWSDQTARSVLTRKPRSGEAQGCAEQSGSRSYHLSDQSAGSRLKQPKAGPQGAVQGGAA
jgi:hypothetical protein